MNIKTVHESYNAQCNELNNYSNTVYSYIQ